MCVTTHNILSLCFIELLFSRGGALKRLKQSNSTATLEFPNSPHRKGQSERGQELLPGEGTVSEGQFKVERDRRVELSHQQEIRCSPFHERTLVRVSRQSGRGHYPDKE